MERHELKNKWGKYCNTEKLVTDMQDWFNKNRIRASSQGICSMLDTFFTNKEEIIKLFEKSDNYIGDMRIMIDTQMNRYSDRNLVYRFVDNFINNKDNEKAILKTVDNTGKKLNDYIHVGAKTVTVADLIDDKFSKNDFSQWKKIFNGEGYTLESDTQYHQFIKIMTCFRNMYEPVISEDFAKNVNHYNENLKLVKGTKTPRVFNKVCTTYGVDKTPKYNKLFAEYADMVTESKREIKFYISVNPLDYLNMSVGRSWRSCHAPGGGYFAGTVSYMLDSTSIITFVHDNIPTDIITEGKIYRNMFHYKDGVLIQSRVYPAGNDGCANLYDEFYKIVQSEIAQNMGVKNNWNPGNVTINTTGKHYPDYRYHKKVYYVGSIPGTKTMDIGHVNICPYCGKETDLRSSSIAHTYCTL